MARIETNKCPNCGGAIEFDPNKQMLKCPYCEGEFPIESVREFNEAEKEAVEDNMNWDVYSSDTGNGDWTGEEKENISAYVCQSCGGEIIADKETAATSCPYCGNPVILPKQFEGMFKPDYVIPFKFDKNSAKNALKNFYKGKILLPKEFKTDNKIEEVQGLYVPYWLFDCDSKADMRFKATRVRTWSDSKFRYVKTSHFSLVRNGEVSFEKIPVDGSSKIEDKYSEAIEPFDYKQSEAFQTAYLTGYLADKYDVSAEQCVPRANERIRESTIEEFRKTVIGYDTVNLISSNINILQGDIKYTMLPMWILNTNYHGKKYTFAMNGQTGKIVGELPTDRLKFWLMSSGIFAGLTAVASVVVAMLFGG
ncbi:MAG: hypothetical protein R3Y33_07215 [Clostridia bacterium]